MTKTPFAVLAVLAAHFERLQMLWRRRQQAIIGPDYYRQDVAELDEQIEAHVDGLLVAGDEAVPLLQQGLCGESEAAFAAAYVLLRRGQPSSADTLIDALQQAEPGQLEGIRQAMCLGSIQQIVDRLQALHASGPPALAAVALEVLTYHRQALAAPSRLVEFYSHADPSVRQAAWRITAMMPPAEPSHADW